LAKVDAVDPTVTNGITANIDNQETLVAQNC
jgi:hypothetical protein